MVNRQKAFNIVKSYLKGLTYPYLGKGNVPLWCHLWVTRRCNLHCQYCYVYNNNYPELDTGEMKRAIEHIKNVLNCNLIALMGGEPTIRRDLPEIIQHMTDLGISSYMTTNGFLLTDRKIFDICEAGLDILEFSIDSMRETPVSQKAGWKRIDTLERLIEYRSVYDLELSVNMVVTRQNYHEVDEILRLLAGKRISLTMGLYVPDPFLRGDPRNDPLAFTTADDLQELTRLANKIIRIKKIGAFIAQGPSYFRKWVPFMQQLITPAKRRHPKIMWKCDPGPNFLEIDCDGRIRFCSYINGNVDTNLTIFDLDRSYYKVLKPKFQKMLRVCNARCLANCFYEVAQIRRHPINFFTDTAVRHLLPQFCNTPEMILVKEAQKMALRAKFRTAELEEIPTIVCK